MAGGPDGEVVEGIVRVDEGQWCLTGDLLMKYK